jgi:uncharacterized protein involved in exopolysaccharide biosynthesis
MTRPPPEFPGPPDGEPLWIAVSRSRTVPAPIYAHAIAPPAVPSPRAAEEEPLLGVTEIRVLAGFPFRALLRRRRFALLLFAAVMLFVSLAALLMERHYRVETKFLASLNVVMPALGNPRRSVPTQSDAPTRQAAEAVLKRENLLQIIRQTNLLTTFDQTRPPLGRARDIIVRAVKGPMPDSDRVNTMIGLLEKRMWIDAKEGAVTIGIDWMNPVAAYRIVQAAQQNFFDQRHASQLAMIGESIGILEGHAATAEQSIEEALRNVRQYTPVIAGIAPPQLVARSTPNSPTIVALQADLARRRQTLADLENARNQRLAAVQGRLAELRNSLGAAHPEVISTEDNLRALLIEPPQIASLRADTASLAQKLRSLGAHQSDIATPALEPLFTRATLERLAAVKADSAEDPRATYAKSRLKIATADYEDLLDRLEGAHIELETARASFKYQYTIVSPAQVPKKAEKPNVLLLLVGGFVLGILLGLFAAVCLDLASGRVLEAWQVNRMLGLPIIAQIERA